MCRYTLQEAQTTLCGAIDGLHTDWGTKKMVYAVAELDEAIDQAEATLAALARQDRGERAEQILAMGLRTLVQHGRDELQRAETFALAEIGRRIAQESIPQNPPHRIFPAGTILSCPACEHGLYKVTTRSTTADLVLDDGTLLVPLNQTISQRNAWTSLSCPLCGGRLFKDGKIHTLQHEWV